MQHFVISEPLKLFAELGGHWAVQLFDKDWILEHSTCDQPVFHNRCATLLTLLQEMMQKSLNFFLAAELKSTVLSWCVMKFHSTNWPCNHICSGMLAESFMGIARLLQGHLLIFILHKEPQFHWFIYHLQVSILVLKPFFIGTIWSFLFGL